MMPLFTWRILIGRWTVSIPHLYSSLFHAFLHTLRPAPMSTPTVGDPIEVYWPDDDDYYRGVVGAYHAANRTFEIWYDDGEIEDLDLSKEQWRTRKSQSERKQKSQSKQPRTAIPSVTVSSPVAVAATSNNELRLPSLPPPSKAENTSQPSTTRRRRRKQASPRERGEGSDGVQVGENHEPCNHRTNSTDCQEHKAAALTLIENCTNKWLLKEERRQMDMFSVHQCLSYTYNTLTVAAVDSGCQSKLLKMKSVRSKWLLTGHAADSTRRVYNSWDRPLTNQEWNFEKLMLAKISALILEGSCGSCRPEIGENKVVNESAEAMRYVLYARERSNHVT